MSKKRNQTTKVNPTKAWAIASGVSILPWTISNRRAITLKEIQENWGKPWKKLRKEGCSVVKVMVAPVTELPEGYWRLLNDGEKRGPEDEVYLHEMKQWIPMSNIFLGSAGSNNDSEFLMTRRWVKP